MASADFTIEGGVAYPKTPEASAAVSNLQSSLNAYAGKYNVDSSAFPLGIDAYFGPLTSTALDAVHKDYSQRGFDALFGSLAAGSAESELSWIERISTAIAHAAAYQATVPIPEVVVAPQIVPTAAPSGAAQGATVTITRIAAPEKKSRALWWIIGGLAVAGAGTALVATRLKKSNRFRRPEAASL